MCTMIDRLEELFEILPDTPDFSDLYHHEDGDFTFYNVNSGEFKSISLFNSPDISIAQSFITKGASVEMHKHPKSYEIVIIISGQAKISYKNGVEKLLNKHDYIVTDKAVPHSAIALEDTKFIALTVPKDHGYPK